METIRRSIKLEIELWKKLNELAIQTNSIAARGPKFGQPSWRVLIRRIAIGELRIMQDE